LAVTAEEEARKRALDSEENKCAAGVLDSIETAGLEPMRRATHAYQTADQLASRSDMKEIEGLTEQELDQLPPGAIIVYGKSETHKSGHIAVVTDETYKGEPMEASDHLQRIRLAGRSIQYGNDFGPGGNEGPRYRVFIPLDPPPP
jgi:hypothetical protein